MVDIQDFINKMEKEIKKIENGSRKIGNPESDKKTLEKDWQKVVNDVKGLTG